MNAMTYPIIYNIGCNPEDHLHSTPNGFKFDREFGYVTQISYTSNVILNKDFTDREVLAVLLHEVGHSFVLVQEQIVPLVVSNRDMIVINSIMLAILYILSGDPISASKQITTLLNSNNFIKKIKYTYHTSLKKSILGKIIDRIDTGIFGRIGIFLSNRINDIFKITGLNNVSKALSLIMNGWPFLGDKGRKNLEKRMRSQNAYGRSMEYFSDNFPASYGLGADLASALEKMEFREMSKSEKVVDAISKLNPLNLLLGELVKLPYYEFLNAVDVHPKYAHRINKIEADLKKELSKSKMNPKMKKELQKSLDEINKMKQNLKQGEKIKENNPVAYKKLWMKMFIDEEEDEFLAPEKKAYTSMEDRDKFFEDMLKEHAEWFENDLYEFVD